MNIAIIGLAGIGAAHAVAAVRAGHTVKWVMDLDPQQVERYGQPTITNSWGSIAEQAEWVPPTFHLHDATIYLPTVEPVDLLIIAVPNHLHQPVLSAWLPYVPKVLIEKPAIIFPTELDDRIVVNYEYTQHPEMTKVGEVGPKAVWFYHNGKVPEVRGSAVLPKDDLAPHCLSVLARWYDLGQCKLDVSIDRVDEFRAKLTPVDQPPVDVWCTYLTPDPDHPLCEFELHLPALLGDVFLDWDDHMMAKMYDAPSNIQLNQQINQLLYPVLK